MEFGEQQTILNGTGTFEGQCLIYAIEDSVADVTFRSKGGNVVKSGLSIPQGTQFFNITKVVLTSGCIACCE